MSESLLAAGAILPGPPTGAEQDTMTARAYRHPALAGATVVRLTGATLGPAEDLSMDHLGFSPTGAVEVGHGRRQALGFPAWALVHDPANGRHALAMVQAMEKLARVARNKPGTAREGYRELADRLGAAAPQLLPTFWEQAGRAYLAADNPRMAGTCFTEARKAERVHGLIVDEVRVRDVHLEFAFVGALTAAMLTAYSREVLGRKAEPEAYQLVKTLCLRRVAGGLPPHAGMAADLRRLAGAAGLDADREADEVAARLLTYPAMTRGQASVWTSYRESLIRLGKQDATVRARLLAIVPDGEGWTAEGADQWLRLLADTGATGALTGTGSGPSAARWLERFLRIRRTGQIRQSRSARLLALAERLTPQLIAEGGLEIAPGPWQADLDLLDLCRSLGVPITFGADQPTGRFDLGAWARDGAPGRRDLTAIAADPILRPWLRESIRRLFGHQRGKTSLSSPPLPDRVLTQMFGTPAVRGVLAELVDEMGGKAAAGPVAGLDTVLTELTALWSPGGMALVPEGFRRLRTADPSAALARSLRAGLLAELSWPAYEKAAAKLATLKSGTSWPELVLHDATTAQIIRPDGEITEHRFPFASGGLSGVHHSHLDCVLVDGDLLVTRFSGLGYRAYWSSRPDQVLTGDWRRPVAGWGVAAGPLPIPGGGLTAGSRPLHAGDTEPPGTAYPVASDGRAFWRCELHREGDRDWEWRWREVDPRTGTTGPTGLPAFFAGATGADLVPVSCRLRPVPAEFAGSPLGARDGLVGWRVTTTPDNMLTGEGIDGRRATVRVRYPDPHARGDDWEMLTGALLMPGATEPLPVTRLRGLPRGDVRLWTADGEHLLADQPDQTPTVPPLDWWHALRARDEPGSAALRKVGEATATALLAVGDAVTDPAELVAAAAANVETCLPEVTDATLRAAISALVARTVVLARRLASIPQGVAPRPAPPPASPRHAPAATDAALGLAWDGLAGANRTYYENSAAPNHQILEQMARIATLFAGAEGDDSVPAVASSWPQLLGGLGAIAVRAASPVTGDTDRTALATFLEAIAGTPLDGSGPPLRILEVTQERMTVGEVAVHRGGDRITVLLPPTKHSAAWRRDVLQIAPDGDFTLPDGLTLRAEARPSGRLAGDRLRTFLRLLAERGPVPWRPAAAGELSAATGMSRAEAALLLAGLPAMADLLTPRQRATLGLTAAEAKVGRNGLTTLSQAHRVALLDAAMPADPADLWDRGPDLPAIAAAWIRFRGRRAPVADRLIAAVDRLIDLPAAPALRAIAEPGNDWLTTDGHTTLTRWGIATTATGGTPFDTDNLHAVAVVLPWLAYNLSWDDPLRAALPEALRLVRERLRNPDLIIGSESLALDEPLDAGPALVAGQKWGPFIDHHLVPAHLTGPDDPALRLLGGPTVAAVRILLSSWIDEAVTTPAGAVGDPHDPRVSVPALVTEVRDRHGLGTDAAAYYLQLLALPDPADKAVQGWTGWKVTALRKVQQELTDAGLVIAAKRERAGRPVFLPGGWQPARAPRLPVETWKQPMLTDAGKIQVPAMSVPRLFGTAWGRVAAGDVPRYHDLEETR
jgi:hypothetical protein